MNKIKVSSTKKRGTIVIDLGEEYADRTFTIYSGRKSTNVKVTDGKLDSKGRFTFEVPDGKNYTLVVEDLSLYNCITRKNRAAQISSSAFFDLLKI